MMADALDEVRKAKSALTARRKEVMDDLENIDKAIAALNMVLGTPSLRHAEAGVSRKPAGARRGRTGIIKPAITEILKRHAPDAVHADQVVQELRESGIPLSAKDPKATAVTAMIRMAQDREEKGLPEGVEREPGNMFRWVSSTRAKDWQPSSAPERPSWQSLGAGRESTAPHALSRP